LSVITFHTFHVLLLTICGRLDGRGHRSLTFQPQSLETPLMVTLKTTAAATAKVALDWIHQIYSRPKFEFKELKDVDF
jgi:hypothetical protein